MIKIEDVTFGGILKVLVLSDWVGRLDDGWNGVIFLIISGWFEGGWKEVIFLVIFPKVDDSDEGVVSEESDVTVAGFENGLAVC